MSDVKYIAAQCPCGRVLKLKPKMAGKRGKCPDCGDPIAVPTLEEAAAAQAKKKRKKKKKAKPEPQPTIAEPSAFEDEEPEDEEVDEPREEEDGDDESGYDEDVVYDTDWEAEGVGGVGGGAILVFTFVLITGALAAIAYGVYINLAISAGDPRQVFTEYIQALQGDRVEEAVSLIVKDQRSFGVSDAEKGELTSFEIVVDRHSVTGKTAKLYYSLRDEGEIVERKVMVLVVEGESWRIDPEASTTETSKLTYD